jgi:hypothetical protein
VALWYGIGSGQGCCTDETLPNVGGGCGLGVMGHVGCTDLNAGSVLGRGSTATGAGDGEVAVLTMVAAAAAVMEATCAGTKDGCVPSQEHCLSDSAWSFLQ